ncbi:MAG: methyltransferase domain-containing protein [Candidatus Lokiarchaeota archaeon]|nr:methyltransferase domain-containing protein [Candidatus Lokiarchaeota archaeon]
MKCKICGNSKENKTYKIKEMMFGLREEFSYLKCGECGCLQIIEVPEDLSNYYENYHQNKTFSKINLGIMKKFRILRDKYTLLGEGLIGKVLYKFFPPIDGLEAIKKVRINKNTRILDVGCGTGTLLKIINDLGFNKLLGVDLYIKDDIIYNDVLKIIKGPIFSIQEKWDLIIFNHSFEHIFNQIKVLKYANQLLNKNGTCLIRIPVVSSFAWDQYGIDWVQIDAPRHFFLHSIKSMKIIAEKSGFQVVDILFDSNEFQFWGSEQYKRDIPLLSPKSYFKNPKYSIFSKKQIKYFKRKAERLNQKKIGDQAAFYLKKNV